jgi:hypothetical protein
MNKHIVWLLFVVISCGQLEKNTQLKSPFTAKKALQTDTLSEAFLNDTIRSIEEVKQTNKYLDSLTKHTHGVSLIIEKPSSDEKNYYVKVGYNGEDRFETYYHFYIEPSTRKITIEDIVSGEKLSLKEWRKQKVKDQVK